VPPPRDSLLDELLRERPRFHRGETEASATAIAQPSLLGPEALAHLRAHEPACYGVDEAVARWIHAVTGPADTTLEIGAGISTIAFALRASRHVAVTPHQAEVDAIRAWGARAGLVMDHVRFVVDDSTHYLPRSDDGPFDLALIDGKHAFPWPIVDWFYAAALVRCQGMVLVDDLTLRAPALLDEFMAGDPCWSRVDHVGPRAVAYRKVWETTRDVAWHLQPFARHPPRRPISAMLIGWLRRVRRGRR
jgi:predicted O-methyltransferase YrrM